MFHPVVPDREIGLSNLPVALMIFPDGIIKPYKIKSRGRYFVLDESKAVCIYTINDKYRLLWNGKTHCYVYAVQETNPIDPVRVNELNEFKKRNKLSEVRHKDIKHASMLRHLINRLTRADAFNALDKKMQEEGTAVEVAVTKQLGDIQNSLQQRQEKHGQQITLSDEQWALAILLNLKNSQLIEPDEYASLVYKIENHILDFAQLIEQLKERRIVSIAEPLDENLEDFIQDLGTQNAPDTAGFMEYLIDSRRGMKEFRPSPVKQWISSLLVASIVIIGIAVPWLVSLIGYYKWGLDLVGLTFIFGIIAIARYHYPLLLPPVALVVFPNNFIIPYKMRRHSKYFLLNKLNYANIFAVNNKHRLMWDGKAACYLYAAPHTTHDKQTLVQTVSILNAKRMVKK